MATDSEKLARPIYNSWEQGGVVDGMSFSLSWLFSVDDKDDGIMEELNSENSEYNNQNNSDYKKRKTPNEETSWATFLLESMSRPAGTSNLFDFISVIFNIKLAKFSL